jgi:hypothetical protein
MRRGSVATVSPVLGAGQDAQDERIVLMSNLFSLLQMVGIHGELAAGVRSFETGEWQMQVGSAGRCSWA